MLHGPIFLDERGECWMLHEQKSVKLSENLSVRWHQYKERTGESFSNYVKRLLDEHLPKEKAVKR